MWNITYLIKKSHMSFEEVVNLPYAVFLSLLKHFRMFELESTEEGRKLLEKHNRLQQTEPDLAKIRSIEGYKQNKKSQEK